MDNDDWVTTSNFMDIIEKKVGQNNDRHICWWQKTANQEVWF